MAICVRCGVDVNGINSLFAFNKQKGRCRSCEMATEQALERFRAAFIQVSNTGNFTLQNLRFLQSGAANDRLNINEALESIRVDALGLLDRMLTNISYQGPLTDQAENHIRQVQSMLAIPDVAASHILRRLSILNIRRGKFYIIPHTQLQDVVLESDEICYLLVWANYYKANTSSTKVVPGRLVATSKKLRFLSMKGGTEVAWNSVMGIRRQNATTNERVGNSIRPVSLSGIYLELSRKTGNGFYAVPDPEVTEAIIDTLVRISKRQLVKTSANSRVVPQEVRAAVWQRDQGRCVQCEATEYLEYDHIIPYSKGGASSVNNVQLLCRRCNQTKSDHI